MTLAFLLLHRTTHTPSAQLRSIRESVTVRSFPLVRTKHHGYPSKPVRWTEVATTHPPHSFHPHGIHHPSSRHLQQASSSSFPSQDSEQNHQKQERRRFSHRREEAQSSHSALNRRRKELHYEHYDSFSCRLPVPTARGSREAGCTCSGRTVATRKGNAARQRRERHA